MSIRPSPRDVDLAVVTALPEELEPVLGLIGGRERWQTFTIDNFLHYYGSFQFGALSFSVVACSLWKIGGNPTTAQVLRLKQVRPRLIVMTGICAGWQEQGIQLGDVIVADRAFHGGEGKRTPAGLRHDIWTYSPPPWLIGWLKDFERDQSWASTIMTPRPKSLRYQAEWLLCQRAAQGHIRLTTNEEWDLLKANSIDYPHVRKWLLTKRLVAEDGTLTDEARQLLQALREQHYGRLEPVPDRDHPEVHYKAFASSDAVVAIDDPFSDLSGHVRGIGALEMEVAALLDAAIQIDTPAFAVKGVSDCGTPDKDDMFHTYAAEASSRWMYQFLRTYAPHFAQMRKRVTPVPEPPSLEPGRPPLPVASAGETLILFGEFDGARHGRSIHPSRYIREWLATSGQPLGLAGQAPRLEALPRVLTSSHEARNAGRDTRAALVVWGEVDDVRGVRALVELIPDGLEADSPLCGAWLPLGQPGGAGGDGDRRVLLELLPAQAAYLIDIGLGIILAQQRRLEEGRSAISRAIERAGPLRPYGQDAGLAYAWRGYLHLVREQYQPALDDLSRALELEPDNALARAWRGVAACALRQFDLAFADLTAARARLPTDDPHRAALLSDLGWTLQERGALDQALECYVEARALLYEAGDTRTRTLNLMRMGTLLERQGQLPDAQQHYEYALGESRRHYLERIEIATLQSLGRLLNRLGQPRQSIDLFEQALRRFEQRGAIDSQGRMLKAQAGIYLGLGDPQAAIAALERAHALFASGTPEAMEIERMLLKLGAPRAKTG